MSVSKEAKNTASETVRIGTLHNKEIMSTLGLTLLDVIPCAFPEHDLIKRLQKEKNALQQAFFARFWRDNGPWALQYCIDNLNRSLFKCTCAGCVGGTCVPITVRAWDKFKYYMHMCGLTFAIVSVKTEELFNRAAVQMRSCIALDLYPTSEQVYPVPEQFDPLAACPFMAPVSHIDLHIVVTSFNNNIGITYGRKLWECKDIQASKEIRKLDLLFARLRTKDSVTQALQALV